MASHVIEAVDDQIKVQRDIGARDRARDEG
jgi:hypothetical protein